MKLELVTVNSDDKKKFIGDWKIIYKDTIMDTTYTDSFSEIKGNYRIGYDIMYSNDYLAISLDAKVFEYLKDGTGKEIFTILCKWDDCNHLRLPYFHFDGIEQFDELVNIIKYIHNDLCNKHGVYG